MIVKKLKGFMKISNSRKLRFLQAFLYTAIYRAYILYKPFKELKNTIGKVNIETSEEVDIASYKIAREVSWAVKKAAEYTPWESKCLVQALTAQKMMKNKGIPVTLYLGVKRDKTGEMLAHAWTRCGTYYLTGGSGRSDYAVVAKFS